MADRKTKKLDIESLSSSMKDTLKHKEDDVARDLMEEREQALKAFQDHFMGKPKEDRTLPPASESSRSNRGKRKARRLSKERVSRKADTSIRFDSIKDNADLDLFSRVDLTSTEKLLIMLLQKIDPDRSGIRISVRNLAETLGVNKNTALDTMISLELKEIIEKNSTPGGTILKLLI